LEGLDAAVIPLSELERTMRIDAEFFSKRHIRVAGLLRGARGQSIQDLASVSDGNHFAIADQFVESGVPYYRGKDVVGHFFIEQCAPHFITQKAYAAEHMRRSHLLRGDVLLSIVGTIGEASLVTADAPATCSCKLAILRPRKVAPEFLAVFLRSELGRSQTDRFTRGAVQMGLLLEDMDQLFIARFSDPFEQRIRKLVETARQEFENANQSSANAEESLTSALGLRDWQTPEPLTYTRRASEAFAANRIDAEYFRPRYRALIKHLEKNAAAYRLRSIGEISAPLKYGCSDLLEYTDSGRIFLRIADLTNKRFEIESVLHVPGNTAFRDSDVVQTDDVLISRSGTLGVAVPITPEFNGAAYGSYFIRTRIDRSVILPEFLVLFVNSLAGQLQVEGKTTGGVQTNLTIPAIESILVPVGSIMWQAQFVEIAERGHMARRRAHDLLSVAQRAVEIAIEKDESAALRALEIHS
jgi:hypothetical protein